jgi:ribosomal subunit interface protein
MVITPIIKLKDIPSSDAVTAKINDRVAKLERFFDRIMACRVTIEQTQRRHHQGKLFNVRIDLTVPGTELLVNRDEHEDLYVAIRDAFDAMERKLEGHAKKIHGEVKVHGETPLGRVTKLFPERGYGFIETADGRELYFHRNSVMGPDFENLEIGNAVTFLEEQGSKGPQATRIMSTHQQVHV